MLRAAVTACSRRCRTSTSASCMWSSSSTSSASSWAAARAVRSQQQQQQQQHRRHFRSGVAHVPRHGGSGYPATGPGANFIKGGEFSKHRVKQEGGASNAADTLLAQHQAESASSSSSSSSSVDAETERDMQEALRARADQIAAGTFMVAADEVRRDGVHAAALAEQPQQPQSKTKRGRRRRQPTVSVSLSTEGAVQERLEEARVEAERERATAASQLGLHDPANVPDPDADDTIQVEDEAQMLDVMLTHLVRMKNPVGEPAFPAYTHEALKDAVVERLSQVMPSYDGPLLTQYQLSMVLQCLAMECVPALLTSHEDLVQVLCPEAPRVGEEMDLEQFPQRGTVYSREFVDHNGKEAIKMHLKFPNGQKVDLDFVIERTAPDVMDILKEIASGQIPGEPEGAATLGDGDHGGVHSLPGMEKRGN